MNKKWDYVGNFLTRFDANYTGAIGNIFCQAVRTGADDVDDVLDYVARDCKNRLRSEYATENRNANYRSLLHSLDDAEAREFAEHILWREHLPRDEYDRLKSESRKSGASKYMGQIKPSEKQLSYLQSLGCPTVPTTMGEASELINQWKKK